MVSGLRRRRAGQGGAAILAGSPGRRWPGEFAAGSSGTTDGGRPEGDCSSLCDDDGAGRGRRRSGLWLSVRVDSRRHADRRWIHERRLLFLFVRAGKPGGSIVRGTTAAYVRATGIITRPSTAGRRASMIQTYGQPHAACATDLRSHVEL